MHVTDFHFAVVSRPQHEDPWVAKLSEALQAKRNQLAKEKHMPAYIVFHNRTLMSMYVGNGSLISRLFSSSIF